MTTLALDLSRFELLKTLLLELIEILRDRQGDTWAAIVRIASGKSATIAIDDTRLHIAVERDSMQVTITAAEPDAVDSFESTGQALKDVMFKRSSLEKAVASGKIFIRAGFSDLLKIRAVVAAVLVDAEIEPRLLSLWGRFEQEW